MFFHHYIYDMNTKPPGELLYLRVGPDSVRCQVCEPVEHFESWLRGILAEMFRLVGVQKGIGLLGPHLGIPLRFFIALVFSRGSCSGLLGAEWYVRCHRRSTTEVEAEDSRPTWPSS